MKCPRCGAHVPAGGKSCGRCGAQFVAGQYRPHRGKVISKGSQKPPKCGKAIQQALGAAAPKSPGMAAQNGRANKPLTRRWWFWAVCVVLVFGILGNISSAIQGSSPGRGSGRAIPSPAAIVESPSPTPTAEPTPPPSPSPSSTPNPTPAPTAEPTPTPAPSPTPEPKADQPSGGDSNNFDTYNNPDQQQTTATYVLNTSTMKVHHPGCRSVKKIAPQNYAEFTGTLEEALARGYTRCGICF